MSALIVIPFHFDESFSYLEFSGRGILSSISYYPVPNNHVFFNLLASVAMKLPLDIDPVFIARSVNIPVTALTVYYFFKLAAKLFVPSIAIVITAAYAFAYPVLLYSFEARGYALFSLFTVLCLYAYLNILLHHVKKKYLVLYGISAALGMYTMPSFIYVSGLVGTFMFIHATASAQNLRQIVYLHLIIALIVAALYLPIIAFNGINFLQKAMANGITETQSIAYINDNIWHHLSDAWYYMFAGQRVSLVAIAPLVFAIGIYLFKGAVPRLWTLLILSMLLSPIAILYIQRVIPFSRTWGYLVIPLCLALGAFLSLATTTFSARKLQSSIISISLTALILMYGVWMSMSAYRFHSETNRIDYVVREYIQQINASSIPINSISRNNDFSWYLAEQIEAELFKNDKQVDITIIDPYAGPIATDVFVTVADAPLIHDGSYTQLPISNDYFRLYVKRTAYK